jgi:hypothetical protein
LKPAVPFTASNFVQLIDLAKGTFKAKGTKDFVIIFFIIPQTFNLTFSIAMAVIMFIVDT